MESHRTTFRRGSLMTFWILRGVRMLGFTHILLQYTSKMAKIQAERSSVTLAEVSPAARE